MSRSIDLLADLSTQLSTLMELIAKKFMDSRTIAISSGLLIVPALTYYVSIRLRRSLTEKYTILYDVSHLGVPRSTKRIKGTALICGGSIAGLWAARVCADHFEDVLVVEPEKWVAEDSGRTPLYNKDESKYSSVPESQKRSRVMQYRSTHLLQPLLLIILRHLYPNIEEIISHYGGRLVPASGNVYSSGIRTAPIDSEPPTFSYPGGDCPRAYSGSRDSYERLLRRLVYEPGGRVRWMSGVVTGLKLSLESGRVESVMVTCEETRAEHMIPTSLVIDCSGASQAGFRLLKHILGQSKSIDDYKVSYNPRMRYREFFFHVPSSLRHSLPIPRGYDNAEMIICSLSSSPPEDYQTFVMVRADGHRIFVLCGGWGDPEVPENPCDIIAWLRSFHVKESIQEWIFETVELITEGDDKPDSSSHSNISCSWIQYDKIPNLPDNFIAAGDAVMRANPIYGQGCMKACIDAVTLDNVLRLMVPEGQSEIPRTFGSKYFRKQFSRISHIWGSTKSSDYGFDTTVPAKGESLKDGRLSRTYAGLLSRLRMKGDKDAVSAVWHVRTFLGPPFLLFSPKIALKVLYIFVRETFSSYFRKWGVLRGM